MQPILFISDLHLNADEPETVERFRHFCRNIAPQAQALYILGDFFEYWAGDDDMAEPFNRSVVDELRQLSDQIPHIYLLHGNRDFLLGTDFAAAAGVTLLPVGGRGQAQAITTKSLLIYGTGRSGGLPGRQLPVRTPVAALLQRCRCAR